MNKQSSWTDRVGPPADPQPTLLDRIYPVGTLGTLDNLARSFNDKHYPEKMSESDRKSLLLYHLHEFAAAAPAPLKAEAAKLTAQLEELEAIQVRYRHQHAAGTSSPESDAEAAQKSSSLAAHIHGTCVRLREKAEEAINSASLATALHEDGSSAVLDHFPCLHHVANKALQITLLQDLGSALHDLHLVTPQVNYTIKPRAHTTSPLADYERETTQTAIDAYYQGGGELAALDMDLHKRLQAHGEKPNYRHTEALSTELLALSKSAALSNTANGFNQHLQDRLVQDYKFDRRDIRGRQRNGTLTGPDPLQQRSAVLDVAYMARWREIASELGDAVYDKKDMLAKPSIKGDPASHVVARIANSAMVKVPTPQRVQD